MFMLALHGSSKIVGLTAAGARLRLENATAFDARLQRTPGGSWVPGKIRMVADQQKIRLFPYRYFPGSGRQHTFVTLELRLTDDEGGVRINWQAKLTRFGLLMFAIPVFLLFFPVLEPDPKMFGTLADVLIWDGMGVAMFATIGWISRSQLAMLTESFDDLFR